MKNVAIGCGIAALVIAAVLVGAGVFTARWVKNQMADAERLSRISGEMKAAYGEPGDFVPPADGIYDPARIDLFVRMRGELLDAGTGLEREVNATAVAGDQKWWNEVRSVVRLLNSGAGYLATADSLLLAAGMSHGEYAHYQVLLLLGEFEDSPEDFVDGSPETATDTEFVQAFEGMVDEYMAEARRVLQSQARNALAAADSAGTDCATCPAWKDYLDEQLAASRERRGYIPLTDPLPVSLAEAYDDRLITLEVTRPRDMGTWLLDILMVMELDDDGQGVKFEIGN